LHPQGKIDFKRDVATMYLEMALSDLAIIERKLQKLDKNLKGARASERNLYIKEQALLQKIKLNLESENPIWQQDLNAEEIKTLSNYQFLTAKPMLLVLNIGEEQIEQASNMASELKTLYPQFAVIAICGKLEMELAQLSEPEAGEFRRSMGLTSPALDKVIELSYQLLGLISFFTTGSDETKAWTISRGITAPKAAGKIHSDIERGFIRAEVISFPDLEQCGNLTEARKKGLLRMEGKDYIVQDGDVINFLFNI
jgi:ribosome-binding ATPase